MASRSGDTRTPCAFRRCARFANNYTPRPALPLTVYGDDSGQWIVRLCQSCFDYLMQQESGERRRLVGALLEEAPPGCEGGVVP